MLKICKVRDPELMASLCTLSPDYLGFDFRSLSPFYLGEIDEALLSIIPPEIKKVGVFDNEDTLQITYLAGRFSLSGVQIEGDVSPMLCEKLVGEGLEIIKVINRTSDIEKYEGVCNKFLIRDGEILAMCATQTPLIVDSKIWEQGSGHSIDFNLDSSQKHNIKNIENWIKNSLR